ANILRRVASDVVVQGLLAAVKTTRVDRRIERSDPIAAHRRTCSAWRFIARLSAALGFAGASSAARNALKCCGVRVIASCAWTSVDHVHGAWSEQAAVQSGLILARAITGFQRCRY